MTLKGRRALVTGGGRGIGRATSLALSAAGSHVVVAARSLTEVEAVSAEIVAAGGSSESTACDVADEVAVDNLFSKFGPFDIVINSAGIVQPIAPVTEVTFVDWRRNIGTNLDGVFLTCRRALPHMVRNNWGRIVNVSAGAAKGNQANWGPYSASKAAVEVLTKVMAAEANGREIRIISIRPGIVDTSMQQEIRDADESMFGRENLERFRGYLTRGLLRPPEDVAKLIVWSMSSDSDVASGDVLIIDDPVIAAKIGVTATGR